MDVLDGFHPIISGWFRERFGSPTDPQRAGWPRIAAGEDVLIAAPTGSGKTLAAFLACLDALVKRALAAPLDDTIAILYISPLKALSNDVHRNLEAPLAELAVYAAKLGERFPEIRVATRTGDTPPAERAKMAKRPPHILVTTPESLYVLLTSASGRVALGSLHTVIVDEIHAVAGDKRGAHLALSLERVDRLVRQTRGRVPTRVGLSATQKPIERIGRLLVGTRRPMPHIVDGGHRREIDLAIEITDDELGAVASNDQLSRVYDRIAALVATHRSTIVFVNTRRLVERVAAALEQRLGEEHVVAHHGSMSRALRLAAEQKLSSARSRPRSRPRRSSSASMSARSISSSSSARRARSRRCSSASAAPVTRSAVLRRAGCSRSPAISCASARRSCAAFARGSSTRSSCATHRSISCRSRSSRCARRRTCARTRSASSCAARRTTRT